MMKRTYSNFNYGCIHVDLQIDTDDAKIGFRYLLSFGVCTYKMVYAKPSFGRTKIELNCVCLVFLFLF